jgi:glycerate kinase
LQTAVTNTTTTSITKQQQQQHHIWYQPCNAIAGEGTVSALIAALNGELVPVLTTDAHGRAVTATYGWLTPATAVIEMSSASGLATVKDLPLSPRCATTFGEFCCIYCCLCCCCCHARATFSFDEAFSAGASLAASG